MGTYTKQIYILIILNFIHTNSYNFIIFINVWSPSFQVAPTLTNSALKYDVLENTTSIIGINYDITELDITTVAAGKFAANGATIKAKNISVFTSTTGNYTATFNLPRIDCNYQVNIQLHQEGEQLRDFGAYVVTTVCKKGSFEYYIIESDNGRSAARSYKFTTYYNSYGFSCIVPHNLSHILYIWPKFFVGFLWWILWYAGVIKIGPKSILTEVCINFNQFEYKNPKNIVVLLLGFVKQIVIYNGISNW